MKQYAIYVNDTVCPFVGQILSGEKKIETRMRDDLKGVVKAAKSEWIAVIQVHTPFEPLVVGYIKLAAGFKFDKNAVNVREMARITGTPYDVKEDGCKYGYVIEDVKSCDPYFVPFNKEKHGRHWTAWEERGY